MPEDRGPHLLWREFKDRGTEAWTRHEVTSLRRMVVIASLRWSKSMVCSMESTTISIVANLHRPRACQNLRL